MQQLFRLLIFLIQPYMFRATNSSILRSTFRLYIQLLIQCTDTAADQWSAAGSVPCTKSCIYSQNVLLRMDEFPARNIQGRIKKINKRKSCCIFLVAYIVVIKHHFYTPQICIKYSFVFLFAVTALFQTSLSVCARCE